MALTLVEILKEVLKSESNELSIARKDQKTIRNNFLGVRTFRALIASQIKELKKQRNEADRNGGGKKSGECQIAINYLRSVLNELTEELVMVRMQSTQCAAYIKQKHVRVVDIDSEWEKAKANEATETNAEQA